MFSALRRTLIRGKSWEYWHPLALYLPIVPYALYLAARARALTFFAAANPAIPAGGLFYEDKYQVLKLFPAAYTPLTVFVSIGTTADEAMEMLEAAGIGFPLIAKPNYGDRGRAVEKLYDAAMLTDYLRTNTVSDTLLQEYVEYPVEVGVLYHRTPNEAHGHITSLTLKEFLSVTGDGKRSLLALITDYPRAFLQLEALRRTTLDLTRVPKVGERVQLGHIGNHSRGTIFLNGNAHIDAALVAVFDRLHEQTEGLYFGRYDIRCRSLDDLRRGEHFRILEYNGVKAEPTHIYEPNASLAVAYVTMFRQWRTIFRIAEANRRSGVYYPPTQAVLTELQQQRRYMRLHREHAV